MVMFYSSLVIFFRMRPPSAEIGSQEGDQADILIDDKIDRTDFIDPHEFGTIDVMGGSSLMAFFRAWSRYLVLLLFAWRPPQPN